MFNKIKSKLNSVFSKTQDVVEEEDNTTKDQEPQQLSDSSKDEVSESVAEIEYEQSRVDELEQDVEDEIDETTKDVEELEHVDSEKYDSNKHSEEIKEIDNEKEEVDRLEKKLEDEIDETEHDVEELEHIKYVKSDDEKEDEENVSKKSRGLFSKLFRKKEEDTSKDLDSEENEFSQEYEKKESLEEIEEKQQENDEKNKLEKNNVDDEDKTSSKPGFLQSAFSGITQKKISENDFKTLWAELELFLLEINIAYEIVEKIEKKMHTAVIGHKFSRMSLKQKVKEVLVEEVSSVMKSKEAHFDTIINEFLEEKRPVVIMMLGVNGTGKTTSIGKVIKHFQNQDKSVVVAAADTFRAAAVEQIQEHCDNLGVKCVKHKHGSDPAAVCYDAIEHAKAKNLDVVLIDTAGRMPNNSNLMNELKKIKRVSHTDMVLFIGDSVSGNDLLDQIELFNEGLGITGVILTKVDTDERPGSVVTTAYSIDSPIFFLGTGQRYEDLVKFDSKYVAEQLFNEEE